VPWAYRVFFRQVGIDPDEHRTPVEAIALERMRAGGFPSRNLLDDALTIATVETGVPIVAFDADRLDGPLGLRMSQPRELLGGDGRPLSSRQVVIADAERAVAVLFADMAEGRGVHPHTERMRLASIQVKGVPDVSVEEALWIVVEVLQGDA
jgi:DNA/RNA-binding domain of Phe-tRNA-synthetase-like protein